MENRTWKIYILELSNGAYYTGITNNLIKRIEMQKNGKGSKCVRAHLPFDVVHVELARNKSLALRREAAIKKLSHEQKKDLIEWGME